MTTTPKQIAQWAQQAEPVSISRSHEDLPIVTLDGVMTEVIRACLPLALCLVLGAMIGAFAVWSALT